MAALALVVTGSSTASAYPRPGQTEVVSLDNDGTPAGGVSGIVSAAASEDLSVVAFWTGANIDPRDTLPLSMDLYARDRRSGETIWVSQGPGGTGYYHDSFTEPAVSADGRYVAFSTTAPMVPQDTNGTTDVFVRDLVAETTEMISNLDPEAIVTPASSPAISGDGRYVAYVQAPVPSATQILLRDREEKTTEVVSVGSEGQPLPGVSAWPTVSADGRYVAFVNSVKPSAGVPYAEVLLRDRQEETTEVVAPGLFELPALDSGWPRPSVSADARYIMFVSDASNLVPRDTNAAPDVFVHDRETGETERVSVSSTGEEAEGTMGPPLGGIVVPEGPSGPCVGSGGTFVQFGAPMSSAFASISADGRYVSFVSMSGNLVAGDTNNCWDAFVHDRLLRTTERVSVSSEGKQGVRAAFGTPSVSSDGRYVAFHHYSDLEPEDTNNSTDTYLRDRGPEIGVGRLDATVSQGAVPASGWATFSGALIASATDPEGDAGPGGALGADLTGASLVYRHETRDLLARLSLASTPPLVGAGVAYGMRFAIDSTSYEVRIDDTGATLHRCTPECTQTASLAGSIGTTGDEVLIAVPLDSVGGAADVPVTEVRAFTQLTAAGTELDDMELPDGLVPEASVRLGIAPASTPEGEVAYTAEVTQTNGDFSGTVDASSLASGEYRVWARACLGPACGARSVEVTL